MFVAYNDFKQYCEKISVGYFLRVTLQNNIQQWQALFKETQALIQVKAISEGDIAAEIEAYRSGS